MPGLIRWLLLIPMWLTGCANMQPAQSPDLTLSGSHLFGVTALAFDPQGKQLASGGFQGDVALWQVPQGLMQGRFRWHPDAVRDLFWIGAGRLLSVSESGRLVLANVADGSIMARRESGAGLTAQVYLAQPQRLVTGYRDGRLRLFDYPDLELVAERNLGAAVIALASDRSGRRLALSTEDRRILLMDADLSGVAVLPSPPRTALTLRFSPDDRQLAAGAWYEIFYWDLTSGVMRRQETEHWGAVSAIDFDPEGNRMVTLGRHTDASLRLVDTADGQVIRRLQAHRLCGAAVRFSPNGRYVASGSDDESIRLFDLNRPYHPQAVGTNW